MYKNKSKNMTTIGKSINHGSNASLFATPEKSSSFYFKPFHRGKSSMDILKNLF